MGGLVASSRVCLAPYYLLGATSSMFGPILELAIFILPEYGNGKMLSSVIYDRFQ